MSSGPFESGEHGVVVGNGFAIIKDELIIGGVIVGNVDDFGFTKLILQFGHEFDLYE